MYQNFITSIQSLINIYIMLLREAAKKVLSPPPLELSCHIFRGFFFRAGPLKKYFFAAALTYKPLISIVKYLWQKSFKDHYKPGLKIRNRPAPCVLVGSGSVFFQGCIRV